MQPLVQQEKDLNYTLQHSSIVLVRNGDGLDSPWSILSQGRGRSCQLFTVQEAARVIANLPEGVVGCMLNVHALEAIAASTGRYSPAPYRDAFAEPITALYASK